MYFTGGPQSAPSGLGGMCTIDFGVPGMNIENAIHLPSGDHSRLAGACARRVIVAGAAGERARLGAVDVDDPEIRSLAILHDVEARALVRDVLAVGRDLWIGGPLQREDVAKREAVGAGAVLCGERTCDRERKEDQCGESNQLAHGPMAGE